MSLPPRYFQKLIESCPDIIIAVDKKGVITFYNDGARRNLGFAQEEVLGKSVLAVYPSLEEAKKVMAALRCGEEGSRSRVSNVETTFKTKKGKEIPVAISAAIIYDGRGREVGSIGFAKDLREIRRKDQMATLCEIAVGLSHEINNSLEVLVNQMSLIEQYVARAASEEDYIVESERLESVARQLRKIQEITRRIGEMAEEGDYGTKEYHNGKRMTDLGAKRRAMLEGEDGKGEGDALAGLRLLVVDDDLGVCHSLRDLLQEQGCRVEIASSGKKAVELLQKGAFDLVLSDVVMPDMDGYELYLFVKEKRPRLPVILMTAFYYDKDHIIKRSCLEGLRGVLFKKPIDPERLRKIILERCGAGLSGQKKSAYPI